MEWKSGRIRPKEVWWNARGLGWKRKKQMQSHTIVLVVTKIIVFLIRLWIMKGGRTRLLVGGRAQFAVDVFISANMLNMRISLYLRSMRVNILTQPRVKTST